MHLGAHLTFFFWSNHIPVTSANDVPHGIEVKERVGPSNAARTTVQMQFKLAADKNMGSDHQRLDKLVSHDDSFIVQWWSGISSLTLNKVLSKLSLQYCSFLDFSFSNVFLEGGNELRKATCTIFIICFSWRPKEKCVGFETTIRANWFFISWFIQRLDSFPTASFSKMTGNVLCISAHMFSVPYSCWGTLVECIFIMGYSGVGSYGLGPTKKIAYCYQRWLPKLLLLKSLGGYQDTYCIPY